MNKSEPRYRPISETFSVIRRQRDADLSVVHRLSPVVYFSAFSRVT